jgi:D-glycero-D-manno-heptose 1,7-bisphosphate phosphatase
VFLDRDGTLTAEGEWVTSSEQLQLLPGASEAVALLSRAGFAVVVATNQSAVARGLLTLEGLDGIHAHLRAELARQDARVDGIYACPHHPTEGAAPYRLDCDCRKPGAGLLRAAARDLDLELARSFVVGDAERDLAAGAAVGARGILVATGKGAAEHTRLAQAGRAPALFLPDVLAAARWIAGHEGPRAQGSA